MALQWTPLRREEQGHGRGQDNAVVRARRTVQTLEHQTQANVLLAFKLSMVSGEGVNRAPLTRSSYRPRRKMADAAVQFDAADCESSGETEPPVVNSTVAEINSSAQLAEQPYHRPLSVGSSASSSSEGVGEKRRPVSEQELDVDAICVQETATELETEQLQLHDERRDTTEPDGFIVQEKEEEEESSCGLDCVYFTMRCCECTIM